jgi:Gene product 88
MFVVRDLLARGNGKLGEAIHHWGLPPISTCPGASLLCSSVCYATRGRYIFPSVRERLRANLDASKRPDFARRLVQEIRRRGVRTLRIHSAGDFYDARYTRAWLRVVSQCPQTVCYTYTRSWRTPSIAPILAQLAALPNARIWYSTDAETGEPDRLPPGVRTAFLQTDLADAPYGHLVFRTQKLRRLTPLPLATCPHETPQGRAAKITCTSCGKCLRPTEEQLADYKPGSHDHGIPF